MFPELKEMPKCQDGRICKGNGNGFCFLPFITEDGNLVHKFVCGNCYLQAIKDSLKH